MAHTNNTQPPPPRPEDRYDGPDAPPAPPSARPTTSGYGDLLAAAIVLLPIAGLVYWFCTIAYEKLGI